MLSLFAAAALTLSAPTAEDFEAACIADAEANGQPGAAEICACMADAAADDAAILQELMDALATADIQARMASLSQDAMAAVAPCLPEPEEA